MRRPEISAFIAVAPPANTYDFSFLAPCPASGLIIHGDADEIVPPADVGKLAQKLSAQRGITIEHRVIRGANHFFNEHMDTLVGHVDGYLAASLTHASKTARASGA